MISIIEAKLQQHWTASSVVRFTTDSVSKAIKDIVKDRDLSIKKLNEDHYAVLSKDTMSIIITEDSPWYRFLDYCHFWNEKQKLTFHQLCESLVTSEEFDLKYYEL
jgi:hypothetical protein